MGYLLGETFDDYVDKQIKLRQKKLGSTTYDNDLISYTTSKDSWLRLTSGVDIDKNRLDTLPGSQSIPEGSGLAKRYVLFGGANNTTTSSKPKGGIIDNYNNSIESNASYGFDSTANYGLTPLPGVTSFNVKPRSGKGSIVEGEIQIKCYNVQQFNHIEALYLRLGYTLLLEWGHTIYFKNDGSFESDITAGNNISKLFLEGDSPDGTDPQIYIQNQIRLAREKSSGNYDAVLGVVRNFSWDVTPEGEYNITVSTLSPGSIIESLSISTTLPNSLLAKEAIEDEDNDDTPSETEDKLESTTIGRILSGFKKTLEYTDSWWKKNFYSRAEQDSPLGTLVRTKISIPLGLSYFSYFTNILTNQRIQDNTRLEGLTPYKGQYYKTVFELAATPLSNALDTYNPSTNPAPPTKELLLFEPRDGENQYYIKLGALLRIIQNFLLLYNTSEDNSPIVNIDWNYEDNICYIPTTIFSADPRICLIPSQLGFNYTIRGERRNYDSFGVGTNKQHIKSLNFVNDALGTSWITGGSLNTADPSKFYFMNLHLNIDFILELLRKNINIEGDLALGDFLLALCKQINSTLSNTTEFSPFIDVDTNTLHIVNMRNSDKILPNKPEPSKFQIGFHKTNTSGSIKFKNGSFIKDLSIKSTISSNLANQISIGAQANNPNINQNSLSFSTWNKGYTDRIVLEKNIPIDTDEAQENRRTSKEEYENTVENAFQAFRRQNDMLWNQDLFELSGDVAQFFKLKSIEDINSDPSITSPLLIPISLSLTMDGLSGMKILEKYTITDEFLPQSYRNNIEFIIKGIDHTIDGSGWVTTIDGEFMPKSKTSLPVSDSTP